MTPRTGLDPDQVVALVERCRSGDEDAWRDLVARYENLVFSTALGTGLDREAAAEVHQRVWVELHRSLPRLRNPGGLPKWLIVTARRIAFESSTRRRGAVVELSEDLIDPEPSSQASIEALEQAQAVHQGMARLKGRCRELLQMLFFDDPRPDYQEIASCMDVAIGSLGSMRSRCLGRLRRAMEESA